MIIDVELYEEPKRLGCRLWYDESDQRFHLGERDLHCGDCFQALIKCVWWDVRIEHSYALRTGVNHGWYLVGVTGVYAIEGLLARFYKEAA